MHVLLKKLHYLSKRARFLRNAALRTFITLAPGANFIAIRESVFKLHTIYVFSNDQKLKFLYLNALWEWL